MAPCSIKTLSGIAMSYADNLLVRAADVMLKERKPLVLLVRETPLHLGHLRLLVQAAEIGAVVMPPMPAFYHRPVSLGEVLDQSVNRALDLLGIEIRATCLQDGKAQLATLCGMCSTVRVLYPSPSSWALKDDLKIH